MARATNLPVTTDPAGPGSGSRPRGRSLVRTFHPRNGRVSQRHLTALERLWPRYGVEVAVNSAVLPAGVVPEVPLLDLPALFGRRSELVLEIGPGMGDATAAAAAADPDRDYLAVEVHTPGIANLLTLIEDQGLANLRVARGDALDLVRYQLAPDLLAGIQIFFPDPWPKTRHHKRRIIQPDRVALLRSRLRVGGWLHCATDWAEYAAVMLATLSADPQLRNTALTEDGFLPRPESRPMTKFEGLGQAAGRTIFDLVFVRSGPSA